MLTVRPTARGVTRLNGPPFNGTSNPTRNAPWCRGGLAHEHVRKMMGRRIQRESRVSTREPHFYDADTISILKSAFDEACAAVSAERLTQALRASIAEQILKIAKTGERDPVRLRIDALMEVTPNRPSTG
jgi:hypothetical protein